MIDFDFTKNLASQNREVYLSTLNTAKEEYKIVEKFCRQLKVRELLLRQLIDKLQDLIEDPDKCKFHIFSKEEMTLKKR